MKMPLKKILQIAYKVLLAPTLLFGAFNLALEIAGYPFMDDLLLSLRVSFTTRQLLGVGFVISTAWLLCFLGSRWLTQKEKQVAAEAEAKARIANHFDPKQTDEALRHADMDIKSRILLEKTIGAYRICYRRVGKAHELIVNGEVYAEMITKWEQNHELKTHVSGHEIRAGYNKIGYNYLIFDGITVAKNLRAFF